MEGVVHLCLLLLIGTPLASSEYRQVAPGIYSFTIDNFYISAFVVTGDGVVATDSMNPDHSEAMIQAIKEVTNEPIKYLILTHNHWDHTGGNGLFREEGATILAHQEAITWMEDNRNPEVVIPDSSWDADYYNFNLGNQTFNLVNLGLTHGAGDTAVLVPNARFLYVSDFVIPGSLPPADFPDFNVGALIENQERVLGMAWDQAVHSHTTRQDALALSPKEDMRNNLQYLKDLREEVRSQLETNPNIFAIPNSIELPQYKDLNNYDNWKSLNAWKILWEEEIGPYSWYPRKGRSLGGDINSSSIGKPSESSTNQRSFSSSSDSSSSSFGKSSGASKRYRGFSSFSSFKSKFHGRHSFNG